MHSFLVCAISSPPFEQELSFRPLSTQVPPSVVRLARFELALFYVQGRRDDQTSLQSETRYYLHTPGRVEVLAQKPRSASANTIIA